MPDKRSENKKDKKPVKRIVDFRILPQDVHRNHKSTITFRVTYIFDKGNLIEDMRKKYTETVTCKDWDAADIKERYLLSSRARLCADLERKIRAIGATDANVQFCVKQLLKSR